MKLCLYYRGGILSFLLFFSIIYHAAAQVISGRVVETGGKGIENANISVLNAKDSSAVKYGVSDKQGYFELHNLTNGILVIKVSCIGYSTRLLNNIKLTGSSVKLTDIVLGTELKELKEVKITQKTPILQRKVDRLIFNLNSTIMANGASLFEALRVAPLLTVSDNSVSMVGKGSMGVMINEKLINLSGVDLTNYLKTLRSENVEKIEIITTPPAKYEAQGNAGLINIVLKKNESLGWRGSISSSLMQQTYSSYNNSLALFFRSKKINSTFTFNQSNYHNIIVESNDITGQLNPIFSKGRRVTTTPNLQAGLSIDYELNKHTNVGVIYNISHSKAHTILNNRSSFNTGSTVDSVLNTNAEISRPVFTQTLNVYHDLKIDSTGKKLNSSVNFFTNRPEIRNNFVSQSETTDATVRNNSLSEYKIWSVQSDLTLPYKGATVETGAKYTIFDNSADVEYFNYANEDFVLDNTRSNKFNYTENNLAGYFSMESELSKKWTSKAGLRYEYTMMDGYSPTLNQRNKRNYGALFPTAYITYKANKDNVFSLNYARRINRPGLNFLNPFAFYSNLYSYSVGNPLLLPSFSNNLELSYLYKGMFSFTVFAQHTSDLFSSITTVNGPSVISTIQNYLSQDNLGTYVSFNRAFFKWWDNGTSATFFLASPKSKIQNIPTENGVSASFSVNNNFKATSKLSFYINYSESLPSTNGNVYTYAQRNLTTGARLKLLNNNLIISSSYFLGTVNKYDIRFNDFVQTIKTDYDYRTFNLGLTYLFGRSKVSGNNKNISFDEKRRAQR